MLFVYGTLLKGEERSHYLSDLKLLSTFKAPGNLYDTGRGYPVAVFDESSNDMITGELYYMYYPDAKLKELDVVESVESKDYERVFLNVGGTRCVSYGAGEALRHRVQDRYKLNGGSWRGFSTFAETDPAAFTLNFEKVQRNIYKEKASPGSEDSIYLEGRFPVIVTAPHATAHVRMGKLKRQEFYTGALTALLHNALGCHALYTNALYDIDPNYSDDSPFKERLSEILEGSDIKLLIDLHGTGPGRKADIFPGMGERREFLLGNQNYLDALANASANHGITIGGEDVFPAAKQLTVSKYAARKLGVPSIQLEIVRELRKPDSSPEGFLRLTRFLKEFIAQISDI